MNSRYFIAFFAAVTCLHDGVQGDVPHPLNATEDLLDAVYHNDYVKARDAITRKAQIEWRNGTDLTPLHVAASKGYVEVMAVLLVSGADKEAVVTNNGDRPLHLAAANGKDAAVAVLVAAGAKLYAEGFRGMTPLLRAADNGHSTTVDLFQTLLYYTLQKPKITNKLATGRLFDAVLKNSHAEVAQAIESGADMEEFRGVFTPLSKAAYNGYLEVMSVLLKAGANKEAADTDGDRPLHDAALTGQDTAVALMAVAGANLHAPGKAGKTPVQRANNATIPFLRSLGAS